MADTPQSNEPVEEAIPAADPFAGAGGKATEAYKRGSQDDGNHLSVKSKMYDINGDGVLDETEKAMRDMDKSGKGYISNQQVYAMMQGHIETQRDLFKMKKVIMGLVVFVVLLALSNLGTSIAAAYLAKDTSTNKNDELVNSDSGEVVKTQTTTLDFEARPAADQSAGERRLCVASKRGVECQTTSLEVVSPRNIISDCAASTTVKIVRTWKANGSTTQTVLCDRRTGGTYNGDKTFVQFDNGVTVSKVINENKYLIDGDAFTQDEGLVCDMETDCDSGLICSNNVCTLLLIADGGQCESDAECESGVCQLPRCFTSPCFGTCGFGATGGMPVSGSSGDSCDANTPCDSALTCYGGDDTSCFSPPCGTCGCDGDEDCSGGSVCVLNPMGLGGLMSCGCDTGTNAGCSGSTPVCTSTMGMPTCTCGSDADCGSGEICALPCGIADATPNCVLQSNLDSDCVGLTGDATSTCNATTTTCMCGGRAC